MTLKLYFDSTSCSCRSILMLLKALVLDVELKEVERLNEKEDPENHVQVSSTHSTLPTLIDGDEVIHDGNAICTYIISKYASGTTLYPVEQKSLVDDKIDYNFKILLPKVENVLYHVLTLKEKIIAKDILDDINSVYSTLNAFLNENSFLTGENITVADLFCSATISTATIFMPISMETYPNLFSWHQKCKSLPYYKDANECGLYKLDSNIESILDGSYRRKSC